MRIDPIAQTHLKIDAFGAFRIETYMQVDDGSKEADGLAEFAGRACYQSFNKPNESTRSNKAYLANIIRQQHESVLEHASASFYVQYASRNMLLELERHRHLSFSVVSTRFVDSGKMKVIIPPALREWHNPNYLAELDPDAKTRYDETVLDLMQQGKTRKEAREAARWLLPGNLETKFVVTGNMRAWRDVLKKRYSVHADAEIREFAEITLTLLRGIAPNSFQDFPNAPFA